jgi:transcriptional regulator with XRE-family HTH domain
LKRGELLKKARKLKGLNLTQMAEKCNCSVGWISQVENDKHEKPLSTPKLKVFSQAYGVHESLILATSPALPKQIKDQIKKMWKDKKFRNRLLVILGYDLSALMEGYEKEKNVKIPSRSYPNPM